MDLIEYVISKYYSLHIYSRKLLTCHIITFTLYNYNDSFFCLILCKDILYNQVQFLTMIETLFFLFFLAYLYVFNKFNFS